MCYRRNAHGTPVTLTSAKPEVLVSVVSLGEMVFMYMIIKLFISLLDRKWGKNER